MAASTRAPGRSSSNRAGAGLRPAAIAWAATLALTGCGDGAAAGPGAFGEELLACQDMVFQVAMQPLEMEFLDAETWHAGDSQELRIGGLLRLLDAKLRPVHYEYECLVRNGRIINSQMK